MDLPDITEVPKFQPDDDLNEGELTKWQILMIRELSRVKNGNAWTARIALLAYNLANQNERRQNERDQRERDTAWGAIAKLLGFLGWIVGIGVAIYAATKK